jgi:hypothetical protein
MKKFVYSFDFTGVENDPYVRKFSWKMPTFPVKGIPDTFDPAFSNKLKQLKVKVTNVSDLYDTLYDINELKPFIDWGFIFYYGGDVGDAIHKGKRDHPEDPKIEEKVRLVDHLVNTYYTKTYILDPDKIDTKIRFMLEGDAGLTKGSITLKDVMGLLSLSRHT